jgi:hypothetical protein
MADRSSISSSHVDRFRFKVDHTAKTCETVSPGKKIQKMSGRKCCKMIIIVVHHD